MGLNKKILLERKKLEDMINTDAEYKEILRQSKKLDKLINALMRGER